MKGKKKFLTAMLALIIMALGDAKALAEYYDNNTGNSWNDAYIISSVDDLKLMRNRVNAGTETGKYYVLNADLNLSSETEWTPIGPIEHTFDGHFDGQNHIITLNINRPSARNVGLFDRMSGTTNPIIRNLNITGTLKGNWVGAFVWGMDSGTIENCTFSGTVEAETWAASFVDLMGGGTITNCRFSGTITSEVESAGGVVAELYDGNVNNCSASAAVSINCSQYAGGIIGLMHGGYAQSCNTQNYLVIPKGEYRGGIVGGATPIVRTNVSGNLWPSDYAEIGGEIQEYSGETDSGRLHVGRVEAVPDAYKTIDLLQRLANNVGTDISNIHWLPADAINPSEPNEPTQAMRDQVENDGYEFAAKLNEIQVAQDGYYVFQVTISDDLVGANVSDLKLYYAEASDFNTASLSSLEKVKSAFGLLPVINGITGSLEASNFFGVKLDTLPKQFLATMFLSASKSMTVYVVKILLALLGGCSVGGLGIAGLTVIGILIWQRSRNKK